MGKVTVEPDSLEHLLLYQADDDWLPIGTANFYAGFFEKDLASSDRIDLEQWRSRPALDRVKETFARMWEYWL